MLFRSFNLLLITLLISSCGNTSVDSDADQNMDSLSIADTVVQFESADPFLLDIDQVLLDSIQAFFGQSSEQSDISAYKYEEGGDGEIVLDSGVVFKGVAKKKAFEAFEKFNEEVKAGGSYLFMTDIDYDDEWNEFYDLAILPCEDQFALVELLGTDGINLDVSNSQIIDQLRDWHEEFGINISYCDYSGIDAFMLDLPADSRKFANELNAICPYVIKEEAGTIEAFIKDFEEDKFFYL